MPAPANLVHQQSTSTGTGNLTLSSVNGKRTFADAFGTGSTTDVFDYFISNQGAAEWERGTGHMSDSTTLVRDTVLESSNSNAAVNFSAGTKDVANDIPADQQVRSSQIREKLTADRTYYVRTDGSDSNDGLTNSSGGAFLTIGKALTTVAKLDIVTFTVTISVQDGTYTGANIIPYVLGSGSVVIQGNTSTPSNCIISVTSNNCFSCSTGLGGVTWTIKGFKLTTTTSGSCIQHTGVGTIQFQDIDFGSCAAVHLFSAASGAILQAIGNYTISGGATRHWDAQSQGSIKVVARTVTITGTPAFSVAFADANRMSFMEVFANTYSGSATGTRYSVTHNSVIFTNGAGATALPGDAAGSTATGGQYI